MRSNYKRLGLYIKEVNKRNNHAAITKLLGINIDKYFMISVANIVGTDLSGYKIVEKGQFACNRMHVGRDKRLPVALSQSGNPFIVSPAYNVFEIIDTEKLLPEYLMMWFSRKEFDRNAWFYTDADVRGGLNWKDFCSMKLPIPFPEKQQEIIKEYNNIVNRIELNNQFIQKLEATAQAIYKHWFVDFEFPDENGNPYKSRGGEMVESELGEIPKGWKLGKLKDIAEIIMGQSPEGETYNAKRIGTALVNGPVEFGEYFTRKIKWTTSPTKLSAYNDLIVCVRGSTVGKYVKSDGVYCLGRGVCGMRAKISQSFVDVLYKICQNKIVSITTGSTFPNLDGATISNFPILVPVENTQIKFEIRVNKLIKITHNYCQEKELLNKLKELILSKLATLE